MSKDPVQPTSPKDPGAAGGTTGDAPGVTGPIGPASSSRPPLRVPSRAVQPKARPALAPALEEWAQVVARLLPGAERDGATFELPAFRLPPERLLEACRTLRNTPESALDYLTCVSGVDYADHVEVVYHLFSIPHPGRGLVLKVDARKEGEDGMARVPSVTGLWPGADWHEREIFDLLGVRFEGHPDLRRILMPEGFDGGYPLRKGYVDAREQRHRKVRQR